MKLIKRIGATLMIFAICIAFAPLASDSEVYAASIRLSKKTVYMAKGKTYQLRVKGTRAKVKWSSSDKTIVTVSKKGKLTAKNYGTATIKAKVKGKTLKCKVKVERKAEKNARTLRNYILKYGKKSGSKRYIKGSKYSGDGSEGSHYNYKVTASTKNRDLTFDYTYSFDGRDDYRKLSMTIDLISGSAAVRTGTAEFYEDDGYGTESFYYADITNQFTHTYDETGENTASGITINKYEEYDYETPTLYITDPAELATESFMRPLCVNITWTFEHFDRLFASKKALKKAKINMKSIGFTKVQY